MNEAQVKDEKDFFNNQTNIQRRYGLAQLYPENDRIGEYYESLIAGYCGNGVKVLEYGCGEGWNAFHISQWGGHIYGIDIADEQIGRAQKKSTEMGLQEKVTFEVMDAENLTYPDNYFDVVCGTGILHHLNIERALGEIARVLKPTGYAFFMEPLGTNPCINFFRYLTPSYRTHGERPLRSPDLKRMQEYFNEVHYKYFDASTLLGFPFKGTSHEKKVINTLDALDQKLFCLFQPARLLAWRVVICLEKPQH